ncbi:MAG: UDP-N-acetylmuramoyl-L-alanine--D-glutamate ligase [Betaproteobacteria bacterium]|nr:UDP-N-acetylmuramoyl-L-alanine--D-glutamate ligase [Betaproteobacteria bacterium]
MESRISSSSLAGKQTLVLGLGISGLAVAKWLAQNGARVRVADTRAAPPGLEALRREVKEVEILSGDFSESLLEACALVVLSPGLPTDLPLLRAARERGLPVVSEIELFSWALDDLYDAGQRPKIIAITGSNGKTTTTALAAHLLRNTGIAAEAAGNIAPAALDALMAAARKRKEQPLPEVWVLELSSFQLEATESLAPDAATVLNISEDHLDRYAGIDAYIAAKKRIFHGATAMVLNRDDSAVCEMGRQVEPEQVRFSFGFGAPGGKNEFGLIESDGEVWLARGEKRLLPVSALRLSGRHNQANALAALALCAAIGIAEEKLLPALESFRGLPHRVEFVTAIGGVDFFDDSKGTNVGATLAALTGLGRPVAVILGGEGKGQDFSPLAAALGEHGRAVALIGRDAGKIGDAIANALSGRELPCQRFSDMEAAVRWCAEKAQPGDAVLLSPACASLDMYRDYAHRAEAFVAAVRKLEAERGQC